MILFKKNKAIFLDRDGTINIDKNYLYKIEEFEFEEKAIEGLKKFCELGFILIIITNQSGLARGFYKSSDLKKLHNWMINELKRNGVKIKKIYYCPHLPDANVNKYKKDCKCRKPKTFLFNKAIKRFNIDPNVSYAVGDKIRDLEICYQSNIKGFLISNNENDYKYSNIKVSRNLYEVALSIENEK